MPRKPDTTDTTASPRAAADTRRKITDLRAALAQLAAEARDLDARRERLMQEREAVEGKARTKPEACELAAAAIDATAQSWLRQSGAAQLAAFGSHGRDVESARDTLRHMLSAGVNVDWRAVVALLAEPLKAGMAAHIEAHDWPEALSANERAAELARLDAAIEAADRERAALDSAVADSGLEVSMRGLPPLPPRPAPRPARPEREPEVRVIRAEPRDLDARPTMPPPPQPLQAESIARLATPARSPDQP
jgi:hypothetical protein